MANLNEAADYFREALVISKKTNNKQDISRYQANLGNILLYKGDLKKAQELLEESLKLREEIGNPNDIANSLNKALTSAIAALKFGASLKISTNIAIIAPQGPPALKPSIPAVITSPSLPTEPNILLFIDSINESCS